jgi:hypothetical protein
MGKFPPYNLKNLIANVPQLSVVFLPIFLTTSVFSMTDVPSAHTLKFAIAVLAIGLPVYLVILSLMSIPGRKFWMVCRGELLEKYSFIKRRPDSESITCIEMNPRRGLRQ